MLALLLAKTVSHGAVKPARAPDFWYVVPETTSASGTLGSVRGIVVPSTFSPTIQTSPIGSTISWHRPDGTRQSFVVQGVSTLTSERGPMEGTTYIPFRKILQYEPDGCCSCASWENSQESIEALSCVIGCAGCGCEGCICSPTFPCPVGPESAMKLVAHNGAGPAITIGKSGARDEVAFVDHGRIAARFDGRHILTKIDAHGRVEIDEPDSITLFGPVTSRAATRDDKALFAWSTAAASVILEQPRSFPAPSYGMGTIELASQPAATARLGRQIAVEPVMDRCKVCGTHPDSIADTDIYDCVPGDSVCYRCVSWECIASENRP
jgi:hypothetical protein